MKLPLHRSSEPVDPQVAAAQAVARRRRRVIFAVLAAVFLVVGYVILSALLPRWWGREVGNHWVKNSSTRGLLYGLAFGLVCTFIPLAIASTVFIRRLNSQARVVILVLAVVVAAPNLLTLAIATGLGEGAHAGNRYMNRAPLFRGATLIGAIVAAVLFALTVWQYRAARKVHTLKKQSKIRRRQPAAVQADGGTPIAAAPIRPSDAPPDRSSRADRR